MLDMCNLWVRSHFHDPYYKRMNTEEVESERIRQRKKTEKDVPPRERYRHTEKGLER
jgi:hypothetical protein